MWTTFWGNPPPTGQIWDLHLAKKQLKYTQGQLLILEQYPLVLERLNTHRQSTHRSRFEGMLITGSPGIGKTSCLWYLLVLHLCKAEPVVLLDDGALYVFASSGIYTLNEETGEVLQSYPFENVLCLVDMDGKGRNLWPLVLSKYSQCFTVAASPPQRDNYHNWVKQNDIATMVLNGPSIEDLRKFSPESVDDENFNDRLRQLINIYGPDMRSLCPAINFSAAELPAAFEQHICAIKAHLEGLHKTELRDLFAHSDRIESLSAFSHTLVHMYGMAGVRQGNDTIRYRIRTPLVLRLLLQSHQQSRLTQLRDMYELFSASSNLAISRGWAFEVLCHAKICEMDELSLHPLSEHDKKLKKTDGASPVRVHIGKRRVEIYEAHKAVGTTVDTSCYYVPAEGNNPTFDSFIPGEASLALQMSIAETHTFKKKGVSMFRKRLMAFDNGRQWKINKMKFVFVVPAGHAFEVPVHRLRDVDFFVLELDVGNEYERFYEDENSEDDDDDDMDIDSGDEDE